MSTITNQFRFGILGCGNLGESLLKLILKSHPKTAVCVSCKTNARSDYISRLYGVTCFTDNKSLAKSSRNIFICVKPFIVKEVCQEIGDHKTVISTAAGVTISQLRRWLPNTIIYRCMPSITIESDFGCVACYGGPTYNDQTLECIFGSQSTLWVNDESKLDIITALSGCGPAWIAVIYEKLVSIGVNLGLNNGESELLVSNVLEGTGKLLQDYSSQAIITKVASKGGATEAGLAFLKVYSLENILSGAVTTAYQRIKTISTTIDKNEQSVVVDDGQSTDQ